mmetsp:Transcript_111102/g.309409  ORF Transcript_111102/g.309409 Transcript_111102/m.309409 type:complete len:231 (-) Transcript_111102:491-1183(-)
MSRGLLVLAPEGRQLQHFPVQERVETVGIQLRAHGGDAVSVAAVHHQVIGHCEDSMLHSPAEIVLLEHVDDAEEVHLLPVQRGVTACPLQLLQPLLAIGRRGRGLLGQTVDAHQQGIVQQALPAQEFRVRTQNVGDLALDFRLHVHTHGDVHPLPVAEGAIARRAHAAAALCLDRQERLTLQGPAIGRRALEVEDEPHLHGQEVAHHYEVHAGRVFPAQGHGMAAEVLDE